ncbi:lasso peptide biosynthesis B2 protein [Erythrobacter dokdonensis]|uniref:lasso peptide biosynthesis B2 protein n=1 Tax=Erythrobacter dokdonensis TaxID=328225 RepID=UPI0009FFCFCD|nr:lasso peptide biosynthesis B2 protein [Erythrobacter dokdonensis]
MSAPQPSPIPPEGSGPRLRDLGWLPAYCARGLAELVRARIVFARLEARDIKLRNERAEAQARAQVVPEPSHIARIAYVLPRLSARLPWRSDCLVQAIAGQNWLGSAGLASEIQIGVQRSSESGFGAHAWLVHDGKLVSGGDISPYEPLLANSVLATNTGRSSSVSSEEAPDPKQTKRAGSTPVSDR